MKIFIFSLLYKNKKLEKELCINLYGKRRNTKIFFLFYVMEISIKVKYLNFKTYYMKQRNAKKITKILSINLFFI